MQPAGDLSPRQRLVSALELALGALLVIGHNVWQILPNEVPVLVVLGLASTRLRSGQGIPPGLGRPKSWGRTVVIAVAAAVLRLGLGEFVIEPLTSQFWPPPQAPAMAAEITDNLSMAFLSLAFVWVFAAFGEEFAYRGYLLARSADIGNRSAAAHWIAVVITAILFGFGHYYKGPSGVIDSGVAGLILGAAYMLSGRNLWAAILAHGFIDTTGVVVLYFGWQS